MNSSLDTRSNRGEDQMETVRQEPNSASDDAFVELGKVSDTRGGWIGPKVDTGMGFLPY
jgi:hypothetical protein